MLSLDLSVGPVQLGKWNKLEIALILGNTGVPVLWWDSPVILSAGNCLKHPETGKYHFWFVWEGQPPGIAFQ